MVCMKRCAIYTRVSTTHQSDEAQLRVLREYCAQRGFEIYQEYSDVMSGSRDDRPSLARLMEDARKRKFSVVVVFRFDRFARSTIFLLRALDEFKTLGVDFISFNEQLDTTSPLGVAIFSIVAALCQLERENIRDRVRMGVRNARLKRGGRWGRPKSCNYEQVKLLHSRGVSIRGIAKQLAISPSSVQRALKGV